MNASTLPPWRPTRWQRAALIAGLVLLLLVAGLLIAQRHLEGVLLHTASARSGRAIRIDGGFEAHVLSRHPTLSAQGVVIGNPPFMPPGVTAEIGAVRVTLAWTFSRHPLEIRRLELQGVTLHLVRDAAGRANWHQAPEGPGAGPPLVRSLAMPAARVSLDDDRRHLKFRGTVSAGDVPGSAPAPLRIEGSGDLNGRPASFTIDGAPLALARHDRPYAFTFEERSGATRLKGQGALEQPFDFRRAQVSFEGSGADLKDAYYATGLRLPRTGAFRAAGRLQRRGMRFEYHDLVVTTGASDVSGTLSVDSSSGRSRTEGELTSRTLRLADLGARSQGSTPAPAPDPPPLRIPDTPLPLDALRRADLHLKVHLGTLELSHLTLQSVQGVVALDHGVFSLQQARAVLGDGSVTVSARLDAAHATPHGELALTASGLPLEQLQGSKQDLAGLSGVLSARVQLEGSGASAHTLAASANGTISAVVPHGAMRAAAADAASLDASGALGMLFKSQKETPVRCAVLNLEASNGVLAVKTLVLDTDRDLISGSGDVHLDTEALDLTLEGRPKRPQLGLHSPIDVHGTLRHPEFRLHGHAAAAQTGAAAALAVLLTPVAALLAFVNPALAHDADCAALISQAGPAPAAGAAGQPPAVRR